MHTDKYEFETLFRPTLSKKEKGQVVYLTIPKPTSGSATSHVGEASKIP